MTDSTFRLLQNKLHETYELQPNRFKVAFVDSVFTTVAKQLKTFPFKWYVPAAMVFALFCWIVSKVVHVGLLTRLASILQYGF